MAKLSGLATTWNTIKEIDLRPLRQSVTQPLDIVLTGMPGAGQHILAEQLQIDPAKPGLHFDSPVRIVDLETIAQQTKPRDLIILILTPLAEQPGSSFETEAELVEKWANANQKALIFFNDTSQSALSTRPGPWFNWHTRRVIHGSVNDTHFLQNNFARAVMELLPDDWLVLGRYYPLFRQAIANQLINDTCLSNAAYSFSTGLAEIVPILDIPLNVTDFFILTKAQAFLVYKLGLALGLSLDWQNYVTEFGGVLGVGYLWRQLARSLIGLIPAYGIIPKVGIAYAGTYVSGHAVLQWYLTGRHITGRQMKQLSSQALAKGKEAAQGLANKLPRPRLSRPRISRPKQKTPALPETISAAALPPQQVCHSCGQSSAPDARFCQYCGLTLDEL